MPYDPSNDKDNAELFKDVCFLIRHLARGIEQTYDHLGMCRWESMGLIQLDAASQFCESLMELLEARDGMPEEEWIDAIVERMHARMAEAEST